MSTALVGSRAQSVDGGPRAARHHRLKVAGVDSSVASASGEDIK